MFVDELKNLLSNVVNGRNPKNDRMFFRKGVRALADETLAANGIFWIGDTSIGKAARRALKRLMAIGKSNDEEPIRILYLSGKVVECRNVVEKKVSLSQIGLFLKARAEIAVGIAKRTAEKIAAENVSLIVLDEVGERFAPNPFFGDSRHLGKCFEQFERVGAFQLLCPFIPGLFGAGPIFKAIPE